MYVLDYKRQIDLIKEMVQLRRDEEKWEAYYHHPSTNEMWKSYFPKANGSKRGPKVLRKEPLPEALEDRLRLCLSSDSIDNAVGLALEFSLKPDKWEQLIDAIEQHFGDYDRSQLCEFIDQLGILNHQELFDEVGYSLEQLSLDEDQIKGLAWRARKLKLKKQFLFWS